MIFYQSYSKIFVKLRQPAIFEPDDIRRSCIPQKKAQNRGTGLVICFALSYEVSNCFLCHLAQKW